MMAGATWHARVGGRGAPTYSVGRWKISAASSRALDGKAGAWRVPAPSVRRRGVCATRIARRHAQTHGRRAVADQGRVSSLFPRGASSSLQPVERGTRNDEGRKKADALL